MRKNIKNLNTRVYPPNGRVRVAVPLRVNDEAVRLFAISKLDWIKQQQTRFVRQERQLTGEFVSGEIHYFQGSRYLLDVIYQDGSSSVSLHNQTRMDLIVPPSSDMAQREQILLSWYRQQLKEMIPPLIARWEAIIGVQVAEWGVKQMKTRWGSCNIRARRIWLNLALINKPVYLLEYVIVHELVHLLERQHNDKFKAYMSKYLPDWRLYREELNIVPPGYGV